MPVTVTALRGNYPNPFNPETTISYDIKDASNVRLDLYNVKGQLVRSLVNQDQAAGRYKVVFNGRDAKGNPLSSGIFLYRFTAGAYSSTRKMMLME
jgi:flagellar hook assembly protein FlgD